MAKKKKKKSVKRTAKKLVPTKNGDNGRDKSGRFVKGNRGGPGNPDNKKTKMFRQTLLAAVKPKDITAVMRKMIELAKGGDTTAAKLVFDRVLGPIVPIVDIDVRQMLQIDFNKLYLDQSQSGDNIVDVRLKEEEEK